MEHFPRIPKCKISIPCIFHGNVNLVIRSILDPVGVWLYARDQDVHCSSRPRSSRRSEDGPLPRIRGHRSQNHAPSWHIPRCSAGIFQRDCVQCNTYWLNLQSVDHDALAECHLRTTRVRGRGTARPRGQGGRPERVPAERGCPIGNRE